MAKKYQTNNYRTEKFGDKYLVTTDHCDFAFLTGEEMRQLASGSIIDPALKSRLIHRGILINDKSIQGIVEKFREKNEFLFQGPSLHIIVTTLRCNHKCVYCHASSRDMSCKGVDMDKETARKTVDFIFKSPSSNIAIEFQGGESLINFETVKEIVAYANGLNRKHKKNLRFNIVTNLTLMNKEKLDYLIKNEVDICTSLDGPKELHDKNRRFFSGNGSYELVSRWITEINGEYSKRKIKNRRLNALVTITKDSLKYPHQIVDEYVSKGFTGVHLRFLNNLGDARGTWKEISYTPEEFISFWKRSMDHIIGLNKNGVRIKERGATIILQKIFDKKDPGFLDLRSPCGAAIGQLAYDHNGDIYTCDEGRMIGEDIFKLGNVKTDDYSETMASTNVCAITSSSINDSVGYCNNCAFKPYCGLCPVCNYAEQGNIIAKVPQTTRCKIFKEQFRYIFEKLKEPANSKILRSWTEKF